MGNRKNEDFNEWEVNLCTAVQTAEYKIYIRLVIFTNKKVPTAILWGDVYAAGSLLEEPFGIAFSTGDSFCIKMILHCSNNDNIRL